MSNPVEIVLIYQSLLGIYGDRGNAMVLLKRLQWRGIEATLTVVDPGDEVPATGSVYLLGGGEDAAQVSAVKALKADGNLFRALDAGAALFAVCAGYQICGNTFTIGEHDRVYRGDDHNLAEIAQMFSQASRFTSNRFPEAGHNLSLGLNAADYHRTVFVFVDECAAADGASRSAEDR